MEPTSPNDELANVPGTVDKCWPGAGPGVYLRLPGSQETWNARGEAINPDSGPQNPRAISVVVPVAAQQPGKAI